MTGLIYASILMIMMIVMFTPWKDKNITALIIVVIISIIVPLNLINAIMEVIK